MRMCQLLGNFLNADDLYNWPLSSLFPFVRPSVRQPLTSETVLSYWKCNFLWVGQSVKIFQKGRKLHFHASNKALLHRDLDTSVFVSFPEICFVLIMYCTLSHMVGHVT